MKIDQSVFESLADKTLGGFLDIIDEKLGDCLDVDLIDGILTIELVSGGQYVISKHVPNRQIWVSSPISGASHYKYDADCGKWLNTRGGDDLSENLARELESATRGGPLNF